MLNLIHIFNLLLFSGRVELSIIELCTLESAALHHPNSSVNLILTSQVFKWTKPMSDLLQSYSNLHLKVQDYDFTCNKVSSNLTWVSIYEQDGNNVCKND